jgi:hypothetical protein
MALMLPERTPMPAPDIGPLVAAFEALGATTPPENEEALRDVVCAYVDESKKAGLWPEQIIIAVKHAARFAQPRINPNLMRRVIDWCVDKYFERDSEVRQIVKE